MVERCLGHTPTLEEAYSVKARVLKHAGDPTGAAASADKARFMDLADRCGPHVTPTPPPLPVCHTTGSFSSRDVSARLLCHPLRRASLAQCTECAGLQVGSSLRWHLANSQCAD